MTSDLAPFARRPVLAAAGAVAVVLTATSGGYGFHRDELYFRMLPPAWGYVDQPPLVPALARTLTRGLADEPWALRLPATAAATAAVVVVALVVRELGGDARAQSLAAWTYGFAVLPLLLGHVLLTSSLDLLAWLLVSWFAIRALRGGDRWWLAAGVTAGAATYARWLILWLVLGLLVGIAVAGPRSALRSRWLWAAGVAGLVVAAPNFGYQLTHDLPQVRMGAALGENNGTEVRITMWPFLLILLGPHLVHVWGRGLVALWRRPAWQAVRPFAVVFAVVLVLTFLSGAQPHYPIGILAVLLAAGWAARRRPPGPAGRAWLAVGAAISVLFSLPVLPARVVAGTPLPAVNVVTADQLGWPAYVRQVARVWAGLPDAERARAAVVTSNYGEAGAIDRYGPGLGLPRPFSGHNGLAAAGRPADDVRTVVLVGGQLPGVRSLFGSCAVVDRLDSGLGVDNEEEGQPIALCRDPVGPWSRLWDSFAHLD